MKIDKVIFTSSEEYSDFWNINSRIYKKYLGIEPICFLFGKKKNTTMDEKYGKVIEIVHNPNKHRLLQLTWFKFWYTSQEPDTTWMIGDIDQIPLQKYWFIENIENIPDNHYVHLNSTTIAQSMGRSYDSWQLHGGNLTGGVDLPAHYHVAKGEIFKKALNLSDDFNVDIDNIINANRYGLGINVWGGKPTDDKYYWCAEENFSSELLHKSFKNKTVDFTLKSYCNTTLKLDRSRTTTPSDYAYNHNLLSSNQYIDVHCIRPFSLQERSLNSILNIAKVI